MMRNYFAHWLGLSKTSNSNVKGEKLDQNPLEDGWTDDWGAARGNKLRAKQKAQAFYSQGIKKS